MRNSLAGLVVISIATGCVAPGRTEVRVTSAGYELDHRRFDSASDVAREVAKLSPAAVHIEACSTTQTRKLTDLVNELASTFAGHTSVNTVECR